HEGAKEVRTAGRPVQVPVLEAVAIESEAGRDAACRGGGSERVHGRGVAAPLVRAPQGRALRGHLGPPGGRAPGQGAAHLRKLSELKFEALDAERLAAAADVVFLALPHMESQRVVPVLRRHGKRAIDLSADYRLADASLYDTWYKKPHEDAQNLRDA